MSESPETTPLSAEDRVRELLAAGQAFVTARGIARTEAEHVLRRAVMATWGWEPDAARATVPAAEPRPCAADESACFDSDCPKHGDNPFDSPEWDRMVDQSARYHDAMLAVPAAEPRPGSADPAGVREWVARHQAVPAGDARYTVDGEPTEDHWPATTFPPAVPAADEDRERLAALGRAFAIEAGHRLQPDGSAYQNDIETMRRVIERAGVSPSTGDAAHAHGDEYEACHYSASDFDRCTVHGGHIGPARYKCDRAGVHDHSLLTRGQLDTHVAERHGSPSTGDAE